MLRQTWLSLQIQALVLLHVDKRLRRQAQADRLLFAPLYRLAQLSQSLGMDMSTAFRFDQATWLDDLDQAMENHGVRQLKQRLTQYIQEDERDGRPTDTLSRALREVSTKQAQSMHLQRERFRAAVRSLSILAETDWSGILHLAMPAVVPDAPLPERLPPVFVDDPKALAESLSGVSTSLYALSDLDRLADLLAIRRHLEAATGADLLRVLALRNLLDFVNQTGYLPLLIQWAENLPRQGDSIP